MLSNALECAKHSNVVLKSHCIVERGGKKHCGRMKIELKRDQQGRQSAATETSRASRHDILNHLLNAENDVEECWKMPTDDDEDMTNI